MQEVARELQGIRQMHSEAMETQRQSFELKLEHLGDKVEQLELEVNALKASGRQVPRKITPSKVATQLGSCSQEETEEGDKELSKRLDRSPKQPQISPSISKTSILNPPNPNTKPTPKSYAQMASTNASQNASEKAWTEVRNGKPKNSIPAPRKTEPEKRRVIFRRVNKSPPRSEANLMPI